MPEENYSFRSTPEILSFREEAIHLAVCNYKLLCIDSWGKMLNEKEIMNRQELQSKKQVKELYLIAIMS